MMKLHSLSRFVGAAGFAAVLAMPQALAAPALRDQFRLALEQAVQGVVPTTADSAELRAYVLYPYLEATRLSTAVRTASDAAVDSAVVAFLGAHGSLPVAGELRRDWLLSLAERRQWADFLRHYAADSATPALTCHYYQARIETGDDAAAIGAPLQAFWKSAPQMPQACVPAFDWLKAQGLLTPEVVEARTRKALADGNAELAEWLLRGLPPTQAAPLQQWARLLRDPARELAAIAAKPDSGVEWEALLAGFSKLAPRDPDRARALLERLGRDRFSPEQHAQLQRWVALGLAWDRRAEAVEWFERLPESAADEQVYEWRVRSALWNRRLELAQMWVGGLPPALAAESRWTYWRARSLEALGRAQQAQPIYEALTRDNGYYSVLAAWRLQQPYSPRSRPFTEDLIAQSELLERPALLRARELHLAGQDRWANAEWRAATRDLDPAMRLQAARLASHWGWHVQAVPILAELDALDMLELSYPEAFDEAIREHARSSGVRADLIYGVMRQESLFHPLAVSPSNAYGLLQLLLPTAREVARRRGERPPSSEDLLRPEVNIPLGATYLREMSGRFDGQIVPALAAYNAGPNAVKRWLPQQPMAADVWIENVPYNQTRSYVQKILWHVAAHGWRSRGEPQDLSPLLQPVRVPAP